MKVKTWKAWWRRPDGAHGAIYVHARRKRGAKRRFWEWIDRAFPKKSYTQLSDIVRWKE